MGLDRRLLVGSLSAFNPLDGQFFTVTVTRARVAAIKRLGIGAERELLENVPLTLLKPLAVFRGLVERPNAENSLCYVARPEWRYELDTGKKIAAPDNRVYLAFVTSQFELYNARWEACDPNDHDKPEGFAERFSKQLEFRR